VGELLKSQQRPGQAVRAIADIIVGERHRRDLGDIAGLAASMADIGLLHPITVDQDGRLLAGARRPELAEKGGKHVTQGNMFFPTPWPWLSWPWPCAALGVLERHAEKVAKQAALIRAEPPPLPQRGPYRVIVADLPWPYETCSVDPTRLAPFPTMSIADMCALPVGSIAHDDSILWLWTINFHIHSALAVGKKIFPWEISFATRANIRRRMKLGDDTMDKLKGTSLDNAREQDALVVLNRGAPEGEQTKIVKQLVADAVAGKHVSAIEYKNGVAPLRAAP
jgi:hypothetical protein